LALGAVVDWLVGTYVSEKRAVSIFMAEVKMLVLGVIIHCDNGGDSILPDLFLQTYPLATLLNPSETHHRHFSPEDGYSTLLRNVYPYQPVYNGA
jgi:hypothetical protein